MKHIYFQFSTILYIYFSSNIFLFWANIFDIHLNAGEIHKLNSISRPTAVKNSDSVTSRVEKSIQEVW